MTPNPSYRGYVYLIGSSRFGWYKIGKSRTAKIRVQTIGLLLPFKIEVFAVWMTENPTGLEKAMHEKCRPLHINGEWFSFTASQLSAFIESEPPLYAVRMFDSDDPDLYKFTNLRHDIIPKNGVTTEQRLIGEAWNKEWKRLTKNVDKTKEGRDEARRLAGLAALEVKNRLESEGRL